MDKKTIDTHITCLLREEKSFLRRKSFFQLVKKFLEFYGTRRIITAFTSARHLSLSWASSIQSIPTQPTSWRSILILSSHLCLGILSGLFPFKFPHQNPVYTSNSPISADAHMPLRNNQQLIEQIELLAPLIHCTTFCIIWTAYESQYNTICLLLQICYKLRSRK